MGLKRRGTGRRQVLNLSNEKQDSPRQTWQTKYQQICAEHSTQSNGRSSGTASSSQVKKGKINNPLRSLLGKYRSDSDSEGEEDAKDQLDSKVSNFLKEIQSIAPSEAGSSNQRQAAVPGAAQHQPQPPPPPPTMSWQECYDESSGYVYYWNVDTNTVTWDMPPEYQAYIASVDPAHWMQYQQQAQQFALTQHHGGAPPDLAAYSQMVSRVDNGKGHDNAANTSYGSKGDKSDCSDTEDERIEMITSYGPATDDESEEEEPIVPKSSGLATTEGRDKSFKTSASSQVAAPSSGSHDSTYLHQKTNAGNLPSLPETVDDISPPGVDLEVEHGSLENRVDIDKPRDNESDVSVTTSDVDMISDPNGGKNISSVGSSIVGNSIEESESRSSAAAAMWRVRRLKMAAALEPLEEVLDAASSAHTTEGESDGNDSVETDEGIILSRLRSQAKVLKELGGEIPDEIRHLIDMSTSNASPAVADNIIAEIEREIPPDHYKKEEEIVLHQDENSKPRKHRTLSFSSGDNSPKTTSFALIAGYGDDSDNEDKILNDWQAKKEKILKKRIPKLGHVTTERDSSLFPTTKNISQSVLEENIMNISIADEVIPNHPKTIDNSQEGDSNRDNDHLVFKVAPKELIIPSINIDDVLHNSTETDTNEQTFLPTVDAFEKVVQSSIEPTTIEIKLSPMAITNDILQSSMEPTAMEKHLHLPVNEGDYDLQSSTKSTSAGPLPIPSVDARDYALQSSTKSTAAAPLLFPSVDASDYASQSSTKSTAAGPLLFLSADASDYALQSSTKTTAAGPLLFPSADASDYALQSSTKTTLSGPLLFSSVDASGYALQSATKTTAAGPLLFPSADASGYAMQSSTKSTAAGPLLFPSADASDYAMQSSTKSTAAGPLLFPSADASGYAMQSSTKSTAAGPLLFPSADASENAIQSSTKSTAAGPLLFPSADASDYALQSPLDSTTAGSLLFPSAKAGDYTLPTSADTGPIFFPSTNANDYGPPPDSSVLEPKERSMQSTNLSDSTTNSKAFKRKKRLELGAIYPTHLAKPASKTDVNKIKALVISESEGMESSSSLTNSTEMSSLVLETEVQDSTTTLSSNTSYTTWTNYNSDPVGGERRGFGFQSLENKEPGNFDISQQSTKQKDKTKASSKRKKGMISFIKAETINLPQIEEDEACAKTETHQQVEELAALIIEKVKFLGEGKDPVPPVQAMAIQIEGEVVLRVIQCDQEESKSDNV
uniref:WW domain-containing protein n=1 Tax=Timema poppense TaxID=170557 RepID=A0A7R9D411_TIMPO|nr:unnamed protein product [Timema poppensis]